MILLVEDDPADVELTLRALKGNNIANEIHVARDGAEALDFLHSATQRPRVVLLDLKIPKGDGMELLKTFMANQPPPKVIVLTAFDKVPKREVPFTRADILQALSEQRAAAQTARG